MNCKLCSVTYYNMILILTNIIILSLPDMTCCLELFFFFGMEEFYSYKEKTLQKRQSRETKYNTTTTKNIYIYNYVQL